MKKFEEEFNYLIELSGKVLTGQIEAEEFEKHREIFLKKYTPQPKPEIPQFVAEWLDRKSLYAINGPIPIEIIEWSQKQTGYADLGRNINHLLKLKVNGYTVAKEKWFYLKSDKQLYDKGEDRSAYIDLYLDNDGDFVTEKIDARKFTQQEIDSMETGSYEQIEVEE